MKIVSWNLLYRNGATLGELVQLIRQEEPALLVMQEATELIDSLPEHVGGHYVRDRLPGRHYGLASWSPKPFKTPHTCLPLPAGMIFERVCQIVEMDGIVVANVHLSHGQLLNRLQLVRICEALPSRSAVLGDCNLIGPPVLAGFHDVGPRGATLVLEGVASLRLDRCFVRGLECRRSERLARGSSDHQPIAVWLSAEGTEHAPAPERRVLRKGKWRLARAPKLPVRVTG